jgi:hypothetical protein
MTKYKCKYCDSIQSTKSSLARHQGTSKTCIKIQESKGIFSHKIPTCIYCKKECYSARLLEHQSICTLKPSSVSSTSMSSIPVSLQPASVSNNITGNENHNNNNTSINDNSTNINITNNNNNITLDFGKFFTDEKISEIFKEYNSEIALEQMKGLAKFIIEKILLMEDAPGYYVRDAMRNIFVYETENGFKHDDNGELLRKKINDGAADQINEMADKIIHQYSILNGKKNADKVEDMKDFKKDIRELNTTAKLMTSIKKDYICKNKEQREERVSKVKDSKNKQKAKKDAMEDQKKQEKERQKKIKMYKFNIDKNRPDVVLSKNNCEPLEYSDKPKIAELGLRYTDYYLEDYTS